MLNLNDLKKDPREFLYEIDKVSGNLIQKLVTYTVFKSGNDIELVRTHEQIVLPREQFESEIEAYHQETLNQINSRSADLIAEISNV